MGFGLNPSEARIATRTLFVLSALLGITVLVSNYRAWRAKSSTTSGAGASRGQDLHASILKITSALAAATIVSGLVGFADRKELLEVESVYASRTIIEIQGPSLGAAVVFVILVGLASSLDALLTWQCYLTGRSIRADDDAPLAKWKSVLAYMYIWLMNLLYWSLSHIPTQVWLRTTPFHDNLSGGPSGPGFYAALACVFLIFLLHLAVSASFIIVFMRSIHHLSEQLHALDPNKVHDLRLLALKSTVYCAGSLLLYLIGWGLFLLYPRNLQTDVSCTAYLLALLVLMELCFVVPLRLPARSNAPPPLVGPGGSPQSAAVEMAALTNAAAGDEVKEEDQQGTAATAAAASGGGLSSFLSILSPRAASSRVLAVLSPREHLAHLTGEYTSQSLVVSSDADCGPHGVSMSGLHSSGGGAGWAGGISRSSMAHYTTASSQAAEIGGSSREKSGDKSNSRGGSSGQAASSGDHSPTRRRRRAPVPHWRELFSTKQQR